MSLVEKVNITTGTGWAQEMCVGKVYVYNFRDNTTGPENDANL
jgi:hypothetical protein